MRSSSGWRQPTELAGCRSWVHPASSLCATDRSTIVLRHMVDLAKVEAGSDEEAEDIFVAAVAHAALVEPVFVVVGKAPDRMTVRVKEICEVVVDEAVGDAALIVAGDASEWVKLRDGLPEAMAEFDAATDNLPSS